MNKDITIDNLIGRVHCGDAIAVLEDMPDNSIHCAITSPPYWSQRDYDDPDQMGDEDEYEDYISYLVTMGEELKRVLRDDGNFFLNIGDKYGRKKQKLLIPHKTAISFQENNWIIRGDYPWIKPSAKPEPVKDRLRERKEYVFHMVQDKSYYFDLDTIREDHAEISIKRMAYGRNEGKHQTEEAKKQGRGKEYLEQTREGVGLENIKEKVRKGKTSLHPLGANPSEVIEVAPETKLHETHFAPYPEELIEPFIKAGCPEKVCAECGKPYERPDIRNVEGWDMPKPKQQCDCNAGTEPGIVMDPFMGSGTTGVVARKLNRNWIGIDIKEKYCNMAEERIKNKPVSLRRFS